MGDSLTGIKNIDSIILFSIVYKMTRLYSLYLSESVVNVNLDIV